MKIITYMMKSVWGVNMHLMSFRGDNNRHVEVIQWKLYEMTTRGIQTEEITTNTL